MPSRDLFSCYIDEPTGSRAKTIVRDVVTQAVESRSQVFIDAIVSCFCHPALSDRSSLLHQAMFSYLKVWIGQLPSDRTSRLLSGMSDVTTSTERVETVNYRRDEPIPGQSYSASASTFNVNQGPAYGQVKSYSATAYTPIQQSEQKSYTREGYGGYGGTSYNDVSVQESQIGEKMSYGLGGTSSYGAGFEKTSFEETDTVDNQSSYGRGTYNRNYGDAVSMLPKTTEEKPSYGERTFGASFQESTTVQESDSVDRTSYGGGYGGYGQNYTDTSIQESDSAIVDRTSYGGGSFGGYGSSKSYADTTVQESESVVDKTYGGGGYGGYGMSYAEKTDTTEAQTYGGYGGDYQETSTKNEIIDEEKSYGGGAYGGYSSNYGDTNVSVQQSQTTEEEKNSYGRGGYGQSSQGEISAQESFQKLSIQDSYGESDARGVASAGFSSEQETYKEEDYTVKGYSSYQASY